MIHPCRLCQNERELKRSHIIPDFFRDDSGMMYPTGKNGRLQPFTQPIHTQTGKRFQRRQHGHWERIHGLVQYMLCGDCEQKFSGLENYAKSFFYGQSNPIRLHLPIINNHCFEVDYKKMKLFQLSLLWRASEAEGEFFSLVNLAARHKESLRQMLINNDPGREDEFSCSITRLVVSPRFEKMFELHHISVETMMTAPVAHEHKGWDSYLFHMGGLLWLYCVSDCGVPKVVRHSLLKDDGRLPVALTNGDDFLIQFATKAIQSGNITRSDVDESIRARTSGK